MLISRKVTEDKISVTGLEYLDVRIAKINPA